MKNKHGIASALISVFLIITFFMPIISAHGVSVTTFKFFSELASSDAPKDPTWLGIVFFIYVGLVGVNILVQLANGSKGFSSFVGSAGIGFMLLFIIVIKSMKFGDEILEVIKDNLGMGVWMSGLSILALLIVPQFFEDDEEEKKEPEDLQTRIFSREPEQNNRRSSAGKTTDDIRTLKEKIAKLEKAEAEKKVVKKEDTPQTQENTAGDVESLKAVAEKLKAEKAKREAEKARLEKERIEKEKLEEELRLLKAKAEQAEKERLMEEIAKLKKELGDSEGNA